MYITNVTDYDIITSSNYSDYDNITDTNICTDNENNIDIIIPTLIFTLPCGLSFLCIISFMVYTLVKTLFNKKYYLSNINGDVSLLKSSSQMYYNRT